MKMKRVCFSRLVALLMFMFLIVGCIPFTSYAEVSEVKKQLQTPTGVQVKVVDFKNGNMTAHGASLSGNIMTLNIKFNKQADANQYWLAMLKRTGENSTFPFEKKGWGNMPDILAREGEKACFSDENPGLNGETVTEDAKTITAVTKVCQLEKQSSDAILNNMCYMKGDKVTVALQAGNMQNNDPGTWKDSEMVTIDIPFDVSSVGKTFTTKGESGGNESGGENSGENGGESGGNKEDAKTITPPKGKKLIFTGQAQVGVEGGQGYTVTGNKAVKVGKYTAVAKLNKGNTWTDGTKDDKKISYTIDPRTNSITVKKTKVTRNFKKKALKKMAKTFTLPKAKAAFGQKNLYYQFAKKPKTDKITLDKNGKVTLKKGLGKGTYSFTVKAHVPAGSTYTAATSKKINVKVVVK